MSRTPSTEPPRPPGEQATTGEPASERLRFSKAQLVLAFAIAGISDAIGIFAGVAPPFIWVVDIATVLLLFAVLGRQWLLLPGLALEAIPGVGVLPFWLLVVVAIALLGTPRPRLKLFKSRSNVVLLLFFILLPAAPAYAHEQRPGYLELREKAAGHYEVVWKQPAVGDLVMRLNPVFPDSCTMTSAERQLSPGAMFTRLTLFCPGGLAGKTIQFAGLEDTITNVLVRVHHQDGSEETHLVHSTAPFVTVRGTAGWSARAWSYLQLGVEHIMLGVDHLLLVLGLLLIVKDRWMLLKTVSAFTVAQTR
jgi:hypothetical protein